MKSHKNIEEQYTPQEIAESFVFPGTKDPEERELMLAEYKKYRKQLSDNETEEGRIFSRLLQLKFQMEDYLANKVFNKSYDFGYFLKEYVARLDKKNKQFAEEIGIDPTELSQILNKHRKPTDKLIYRLHIHSNSGLPAIMWFRLLEKERIHELTYNKDVINNERPHVKQTLSFSF